MTTSAKPSLSVVSEQNGGEVEGGRTVVRGLLLQRLGGSRQRVVCVSAPAGSGKTTVARQWSDLDTRPHAAVSTSAGLDDPALLAESLIAALGEIGPATTKVAGRVSAAEPAFSTAVVPLVAALVAGRRSPFVLVVDDLQAIHDPASHLLLRTVAESLPDGSQLLLLSRRPAPEWLGRLRADGDVLDVVSTDLALDTAEAAELLGVLGVELEDDDAAAVIGRAEGWAAGLCLLARSEGLRSAPVDVHAADRHVADYVRSEMLAALSDDDRSFLVHCSVLDVLAAEVCDALLGRSDSASVLARLHESVLLLQEVDPGARSYRCHRLLQQALLDELEATDAAARTGLHARAAAWYAGRRAVDDAVRHAKAAGDVALLGELVWSDMASCIGRGRPDVLVRRLDGIDEADLLADRWLALASAWAQLQTGRRDGMERWLRVAERHAGRGWAARAADDEYAASVAYLAALAGRGTLGEAVALCADARRGLPPDSPFQSSAAFLEGVCRTLQRDTATGLDRLRDAERLARTLSVPIIEANSLAWQGLLLVLSGDVSRGARTILGGVELFRTHGLERLASSSFSLSAQALALSLQRDRAAADVLAQARRASVLTRELAPWVDVVCRLMQARAAVAVGNAPLARQLVTEAKTFLNADLADSLARDLLLDVESTLRMMSVEGVSAAALTPAEMRVLQFLPSHLTFPQIGEHLFLTANTVKTHAHSIYRKLAVTSRDDAVLRAQALGLIESHPG